MCLRSLILALLVTFYGAPTSAQEADETLVMRLIFEDCLGYVRDGVEPFEGLEVLPYDQGRGPFIVKTLPDTIPRRYILDQRYVAAWGVDDGRVFCIITAPPPEHLLNTDRLLSTEPEDEDRRLEFDYVRLLPLLEEHAEALGLFEGRRSIGRNTQLTLSWREPPNTTALDPVAYLTIEGAPVPGVVKLDRITVAGDF